MKDKYFVNEWNNEMHRCILSLLMDDDSYLIYKHVVVYPTSIFVSMITSIQETAYGVICYGENIFYERAALYV